MTRVVFKGKAHGNKGYVIYCGDPNATVIITETADISGKVSDGVRILKDEGNNLPAPPDAD